MEQMTGQGPSVHQSAIPQPLGEFVMLEEIKTKQVGQIILPENYSEGALLKARVLGVSCARPAGSLIGNEKLAPECPVKVGDEVLFFFEATVKYRHNGVEYHFIRESQIVAKL